MAVNISKSLAHFELTFFRQMHTPVQVLIHQIIESQCADDTRVDTPSEKGCVQCEQHPWSLENEDQSGSVPPRHRDQFLIFFVLKMIRIVRLKELVVYLGVGAKWISQIFPGTVHDKTMKGPFAETGIHQANYD